MGAVFTNPCLDEDCCDSKKVRQMEREGPISPTAATMTAASAALRLCLHDEGEAIDDRRLETLLQLYEPNEDGMYEERMLAGLLQKFVSVRSEVNRGFEEVVTVALSMLQQYCSQDPGFEGQRCRSCTIDDASRRGPLDAAAFRNAVVEALKALPLGPEAQRELLDRLISDRLWERIRELTDELFRLHDLNGDELLEESELVQLNKKIAMQYAGKDVDKAAIAAKYRDLFRDKLDPSGSPVNAARFRQHIEDELNAMDTDPFAQIMTLEQWVVNAVSARCAFHDSSFHSIQDLPFVLHLKLNDLSPVDECSNQVSTPPVARPAPNSRVQLAVPRAPPPSEGANSGISATSLVSVPASDVSPRGSKLVVTTVDPKMEMQALRGGA